MNIDERIEEEKVKRLLAWKTGNKPGPVKIDIEPHRRCNLFCFSCSRREDPKFEFINEYSEGVEMPVERWLEIVNEAADLGVMTWHIAGGGDPPMVPHITFPIMNEIKKRGMHGIMTTNGNHINDEQVKFIVDIGWDRLHFSVDGPDAKTHDTLRGLKGTFDMTIATIKKIKRYRDSKGVEAPMLNLNNVLSIKNYKKLPQMVELAHELGIEYMFVEPLIIYSKWGAALKLRDEHIKEFPIYLKKAIALSVKYNIPNNFASLDKNLDMKLIKKSSAMNEVVEEDSKKFDHPLLSIPCFDPWYHMSIKVDGRTTSCDVATDEGVNARTTPLKDIWYGEYFTRHRKMQFHKDLPEFCKQCNPSHTTQRRKLRIKIEENMAKDRINKKMPALGKWMKRLNVL